MFWTRFLMILAVDLAVYIVVYTWFPDRRPSRG